MKGRLKPCSLTKWEFGRWREIAEIRLPKIEYRSAEFNSSDLLVYWKDPVKFYYEGDFDFMINIEIAD